MRNTEKNNVSCKQVKQCQFSKIDNKWQPVGTFTDSDIKEIYEAIKKEYKLK